MGYDLDKIFDDIKKIKIGVIGDVMLDTYWWGHVERISPEAPVPVVAIDRREQRIGGAGNVALNVESLGAQVSLLTVLGNDEDGLIFRKALQNKNINDAGIFVSENRVTTNKIRIISRNQQMMRLDTEHVEDISPGEANAFYKIIENYILNDKPGIIIFQDYNKGVLTHDLILRVISLCNKLDVITAVDPKRKNFFSYKEVTVFKPNLKEVKESLHWLSDHIDASVLSEMHNELFNKLNHRISLITLSEKGIYYKSESNGAVIPSHIRNVADVSGAGDTVIAVAALIYAVTKDQYLMAEIANIAGGLVCEEVGTAIINKHLLIKECLKLIK